MNTNYNYNESQIQLKRKQEAKQRGIAGEQKAVDYLISKNYTILHRNWRTKKGEIDIIAQNKSYICVVEVKTRNSNGFGTPADAVDCFKQRRIIKTAEHFLMNNPCELQPRFDVAEVIMENGEVKSFNYIENAFDA